MIKVEWNNLNKDDKEMMLKFLIVVQAYDEEIIDSTKISDKKREFVKDMHDYVKYLYSIKTHYDNVFEHILKFQRHIIENIVIKYYTPEIIKLTRKKKLNKIFDE